MAILEPKNLKQSAAQALSGAAYAPGKLVLIHSGISLGASLLVAVLNFLLAQGIGGTGGLSGMGLRAILETAQSVLSMGTSLLLPFWEAGLIFAAVCWARNSSPGPQALTHGFRRFGPVLRLMLARFGLYFLIGIACINISSFAVMLFPVPQEFEELVMQLQTESMTDIQTLLEQIPMDVLLEAMLPTLIVFSVLYLGAVIISGYYLRLADYIVLDEPKTGAIAAILESFRLMRGNCRNMLRLDLSFWWYFAIQAALAVLCYADVLLPAVGITLPFSANVGFFVFYILYTLCQLALYWKCRAGVETSYAKVYSDLRTPPTE